MLQRVISSKVAQLLGAIVTVVALFMLVPGRVEVLDAEQTYIGHLLPEIQESQTISQSFLSHSPGLARIDVIMATFKRRNTQSVTLRLKDVETGEEVASVTAGPLSIPDTHEYTTFRFAALPASKDKTYLLTLESPASRPGNAFSAWASPKTIYSSGQFYLGGKPAEGSLAFRTYFERTAVDMIGEFLAGFGRSEAMLVLGALAALLVPGWFLMVVLLHDAPFDFVERMAISIGLSVAFVPLLLLYSSATGLRMTEELAWLAVGLLMVVTISVVAVRLLRRTRVKSNERARLLTLRTDGVGAPSRLLRDFAGPRLPQLAVLAVMLAAVYTRLMVLPWLSVPMWADSVHHTLLTQLVIERGVIPDSFEPYFPLSSVLYHTGYHTFLAFFHWLSGAGALLSVSLAGQLLNAFTVLAVYLLTVRLTGNRWAGVFAGVVGGFVSIMPAYYANWGRYTQLAGQAILPAAVVVTIHALSLAKRDWRWIVAISMASAGMLLVHVRVVMFYGLFVVIYALYLSVLKSKSRQELVEVWLRLFIAGVIAVALVSPRLYYWAEKNVTTTISSSPQVSQEEWSTMMTLYNGWGDLGKLVGYPLIALSLVAVAYVCKKRQMPLVAVLLWTLSLFALATLTVGLLKKPVVNNFTVLIALYIPFSIVSGYFLSDVAKAARPRFRGTPFVIAVLTVAVIIWGMRAQLGMFDPAYLLVTKNDERAIQWIKTNTPEQAVFLANALPDAVRTSLQGTDAGWWIRFLTGRTSTLPPMLYVAERSSEADYSEKVNKWYTSVIPILGTGKEFGLLREWGVTHIYVGESGRGIDVWKLEESRNYEVVYRDGNIRIFRVMYD